MKIKRISILFLSCLLIVISSFGSYAAVRSSSNATMALLPADDSGISTYSSLASISNTVDYSGMKLYVQAVDNETGLYRYFYPDIIDNKGNYRYYVPDGYTLLYFGFNLRKSAIPNPGIYRMQVDNYSEVSIDYNLYRIATYKSSQNVATVNKFMTISNYLEQSSGDFYIDMVVQLGSISEMNLIGTLSSELPAGSLVSGRIMINFSPSSNSPDYQSVTISDSTNLDYQSDVSSSLSDISSSLGSATESLEYISQSQNLIIQGIDNLILHISDQLYALWDQMYNLMHVPTMAKLDEILSSLRAIANNSDIYAVVEEIDSSSKEQTSQIVQNANDNTSKVEQAVEKHGNFIIEGLKGLFIPSDEYFKGYFDDLYTFFSDRFGFLSFPIDLLQRLADLFLNSDDVDCVLTLPSFEISGEQLLTEQSFNLTEFLETNFSMLLSALRIVGDCIIIGAFVNLCSKKWDEVMKN